MNMRERIASLCHKQWAGWMKYLFSQCIQYNPYDQPLDLRGCYIMPRWAVGRWKRQMKDDYTELTQKEQESDLREADKFIEEMKK